MEEHIAQQPHDRHPGSPGSRPRSQAFRRPRVLLMMLCAAVLAVALGAGFHSAAQARSTAAAQPAGQSESQAPASAPASPAASPATPAAGTIDAELDAEINAIIDANSEYQIGVALVDLSAGADAAGTVHEYGVRAAFVAASTAKVLAAAAYYHLVETGAASLDDPLGVPTPRNSSSRR